MEIVPLERIENRIYLIHGQKVMLDKDLAELYAVKTKVFNQAVKRHKNRFPSDFMFKLSAEELKALRSQTVTLKRGAHAKYLPYAFTENGVAMLSGVLNTERAVSVNIQIMRAFTQLRTLHEKRKILLNQLNKHEIKLLRHDRQFQEVFQVLENMRMVPENVKKNKIGFKP